jgi:hypothetical protein
MKRPIESDYTSHVAYTRALEEYCDTLAQPAPVQPVATLFGSLPVYDTTPPAAPVPPAWFPAVENILNEYGLQAINFFADFKAAMKDAQQATELQQAYRTSDAYTIGFKDGQAAQPAPVPLTDEQISAIGSKIFPSTWNTRHVEFARAIEAAHGIAEKGQS